MNRIIQTTVVAVSKPARLSSSLYSTASSAIASTSTLSSSSSSPPSIPRGTRLYSPSVDHITEKLNTTLLSPRACALPIPLLLTALTAKSALISSTSSSESNNSRLSFLGRRVLRMHLTLFLASEEATMSEEGVEKYCETKELGAGVGRVWELESVMRWREVRGQNGEPSGLYKARGTAFEAILGAVYLHHGIQQSSHLFKTTILPHLTLPISTKPGVKTVFEEAMKLEKV